MQIFKVSWQLGTNVTKWSYPFDLVLPFSEYIQGYNSKKEKITIGTELLTTEHYE